MDIEQARREAIITACERTTQSISGFRKQEHCATASIAIAAYEDALRERGYAVLPVEATEEMMADGCELECVRHECQTAGKCQDTHRRRYAGEMWDIMTATFLEGKR